LPLPEKIEVLKRAFKEGALVVTEEFNTGPWPNELLNNFLMGLDENGQAATTPGFMLIGTQNPPSFVGRFEMDPAIRRRAIKISLSQEPNQWPVITNEQQLGKQQTVATPVAETYNASLPIQTLEANTSNSQPLTFHYNLSRKKAEAKSESDQNISKEKSKPFPKP